MVGEQGLFWRAVVYRLLVLRYDRLKRFAGDDKHPQRLANLRGGERHAKVLSREDFFHTGNKLRDFGRGDVFVGDRLGFLAEHRVAVLHDGVFRHFVILPLWSISASTWRGFRSAPKRSALPSAAR